MRFCAQEVRRRFVKTKPKRHRGRTDRVNKRQSRGPAYWIGLATVMGSLAVSTISGGKTVVLGHTNKLATWAVTTQASQAKVIRFNIAPGPLDTVAETFHKAAGVKVSFASANIGSVLSPGVSGLYSSEDALKKLLAGTGISYYFSSPQSVTLDLQVPSVAVDIVSHIFPSSPKYTEPIRDTHQTITVIPKTVIEEQGATTLRDVLINVPGLTMTAGEGGTPAGDNLTIRGFSARNDIFID